MSEIRLEDIVIRDELLPGDVSYMSYMQAVDYYRTRGWTVNFERYVIISAAEFMEGFDPERDHVWLAEHNGEIVGSMALKDRGETAQLRYLILKPEYRGCGLGRKLFNASLDFAREKGYKKAYLSTEQGCSTAVPMYERLGFVKIGEHVNNDWGPEPALELEYELEL